MDFLTLFFAPMMVAARWPAAPFVVAGVFALAHWRLMRRHGWPWQIQMWRRPLLFACAIWLVYGLYELQVQATPQAANLRIDLLVLTPILYVFSVAGGWWFHRCWHDPRKGFVQQPEDAAPIGSAGGQEPPRPDNGADTPEDRR